MEERFWRLLGVFESLSRNETVALKERNFPCLSRIQDTKTQILADLLDLAKELGIDCTHPRVKVPVHKILENQRLNALLIKNYLSAKATARLAAESTVRRLRRLGKIYNSGSPGGSRSTFAA
jgi:hypothetical protein